MYSKNREDRSAELIVAKQRNGPTGTIKVTFLDKSTRFEDAAGDFYGDEGDMEEVYDEAYDESGEAPF